MSDSGFHLPPSCLPVFLVGYMASGKTTLGRALAKGMGREFYDLDFAIEQRFRKTVGEMFAEEGEMVFRSRESAMLKEIGQYCGVVVSCGGGTPCHGENMDWMLAHGLVIWLDADTECIARRVELAPGQRPLLRDMSGDELREYIAEHLQSRISHYRRAHLRIDSKRLETRAQIDQTVADTLREIDKLQRNLTE